MAMYSAPPTSEEIECGMKKRMCVDVCMHANGQNVIDFPQSLYPRDFLGLLFTGASKYFR